MKTFDKLVNDWVRSGQSERLGQYFCNNYINHAWPELYYLNDFEECKTIICAWLNITMNIDTLPEKISETK